MSVSSSSSWSTTDHPIEEEGADGVTSLHDPDRQIVARLDKSGESYIDARPDYSSRAMVALLERVDELGFDVDDDGEWDDEILEDGSVRIYIVEGGSW